MPTAPLQPCAEPRCPVLVTSGRCLAHQPPPKPDHRRRLETRLYRRWYATVRWFRLRDNVRMTAASTCAGCGRVVLELDVDHITPHRGNPKLFWKRENLQALCKRCHALKSAAGQ